MNLHNLTKSILENGGASYSLQYGELSKGYAVSIHKEREVVLPVPEFSPNDLRNFVLENSDLLNETGNFVGAWIENGDVYLDVSTVISQKNKALRLAKDNKQLAIFDLNKKETIYA